MAKKKSKKKAKAKAKQTERDCMPTALRDEFNRSKAAFTQSEENKVYEIALQALKLYIGQLEQEKQRMGDDDVAHDVAMLIYTGLEEYYFVTFGDEEQVMEMLQSVVETLERRWKEVRNAPTLS